MKRLFSALVILATFGIVAEAFCQDVYVNPYLRRNGTYVPGHYQTRPDGNTFNNYSTQGNVNPYTGRSGSVNPYSNPTPSNRGMWIDRSRQNPYGW